MTRDAFLRELTACPLVASVQASPGSPVQDVGTLARLARASAGEGVRVLRLEGAESIKGIRAAVGLPTIGLIKREYPGSEVYITPTRTEVDELIKLGCEVIALDATRRPRPGEDDLAALVARIHAAGRLAMGDCDCAESVAVAQAAGCDVVGTTLAGYTDARAATRGPDLELLRALRGVGVPVLAEGRFSTEADVRTALLLGAAGVVIGGALNDPVKQTARFVKVTQRTEGPVGAVDVGGTWLRWAVVGRDQTVHHSERVELPKTHAERVAWVSERVVRSGVRAVGVCAGGTIDPWTNRIWESTELIPGQKEATWTLPMPTLALNDGLATAWAHGVMPETAGQRTLTLAIGTGLGAGFVANGELVMGPRGEYPRLNDLRAPNGRRLEEVVGGRWLGGEPSGEMLNQASEMIRYLLRTGQGLYAPDTVVLSGGVGLSDWVWEAAQKETWPFRLMRSPYGADAGLMGAALLALLPPGALVLR